MGGGGVATQKTEKPVPNLKFAIAFGFFFGFFGIFRFLWYFFGFFCLNFGKKNSSHSQIMSTMRSCGAKNCLIKHLMPIKPCKCLIKATYHNQLEPLNNPLNQSKLAKMEKREKTEKKPVPNLNFAVVFRVSMCCNPPPPPYM